MEKLLLIKDDPLRQQKRQRSNAERSTGQQVFQHTDGKTETISEQVRPVDGPEIDCNQTVHGCDLRQARHIGRGETKEHNNNR
jgi:hypothetical protein